LKNDLLFKSKKKINKNNNNYLFITTENELLIIWVIKIKRGLFISDDNNCGIV
jgi:hypothetical protein